MARPGFPLASNCLVDWLDRSTLVSPALPSSDHPSGTVLVRAGESPPIWFPCGPAVASALRFSANGTIVEAAAAGCEGIVPLECAITDGVASQQVVVQSGGTFAWMERDRFRVLFEASPPFRDRVLAFTTLMLDQLMQNGLCNRLHSIEQRLAKWLLLARERTGRDEILVTHEFLSQMLGVQRPAVSLVVEALEHEELVTAGRRRLALCHPDALRERACECFEIIRADRASFLSTFGGAGRGACNLGGETGSSSAVRGLRI